MKTLKLHSEQNFGITTISNVFLDEYMPSANGNYVKIYLYLLRCMQSEHWELSFAGICDLFDCTEGDVLRALNYWEKAHLLSIRTDASGQITDLHLLEPVSPSAQAVSQPPLLQKHRPQHAPYSVPDTNLQPNTPSMIQQTQGQHHIPVSQVNMQGQQNTPASQVNMQGQQNTPASQVNIQGQQNTSTSQVNMQGQVVSSTYHRRDYSETELQQLSKDNTYKWILTVVEDYLEHPLTPQDIQLIIFLYVDLHFSAELIFHLFEYCIERGKRRTNYIEKVAISWAEKNVKTPDDAMNASIEFNADYSAVCKAFGLNRMPGTVEQNFINRWVKEFGFDRNIIVEACNRTLLKIQKPDFKYANQILEYWHKNGVKQFSDIAKQDELYKSKQQNNGKPVQKAPASNNQFNAFPQRNYSKEEVTSLEERLLKKNIHFQ